MKRYSRYLNREDVDSEVVDDSIADGSTFIDATEANAGVTEASTAIDGAVEDTNEAAEILEEVDDKIEDAEAIVEAAEQKAEEEGTAPEIPIEEVAVIQESIFHYGKRVGYSNSEISHLQVSAESAYSNSYEAYKLSIEGLKEIGASIKNGIIAAWEWIVKKLKQFWEWIKSLFSSSEKEAKKVEEEAKKVDEEAKAEDGQSKKVEDLDPEDKEEVEKTAEQMTNTNPNEVKEEAKNIQDALKETEKSTDVLDEGLAQLAKIAGIAKGDKSEVTKEKMQSALDAFAKTVGGVSKYLKNAVNKVSLKLNPSKKKAYNNAIRSLLTSKAREMNMSPEEAVKKYADKVIMNGNGTFVIISDELGKRNITGKVDVEQDKVEKDPSEKVNIKDTADVVKLSVNYSGIATDLNKFIGNIQASADRASAKITKIINNIESSGLLNSTDPEVAQTVKKFTTTVMNCGGVIKEISTGPIKDLATNNRKNVIYLNKAIKTFKKNTGNKKGSKKK